MTKPKKSSNKKAKSEYAAKKGCKNQCTHIFREELPMPARFGTQRGGIAVGRCENECFPELNVCYEHADKATLGTLCNMYREEIRKLKLAKKKGKRDGRS